MAHIPQDLVYSYWRSQWKDSGWASLIMPLIDFCEEHKIEIPQIKEKFGGLRFYVGPADSKIVTELDAQIDAAERASYNVCEICAAPGRRCSPSGGWLHTYCEPCDIAEKAKWSEERKKYETLLSEKETK
jgi:hypothetical protein